MTSEPPTPHGRRGPLVAAPRAADLDLARPAPSAPAGPAPRSVGDEPVSIPLPDGVASARRPRRGRGGAGAEPPAAHTVAPRTQLLGLLAMAVLLVAVPVLGYVGARQVLDSRDGTFIESRTDPDSPGYRAIVEPTPTALLVQRAPDGAVHSLTFLALGNGDAGGSALMLPLATRLPTPIGEIATLADVAREGGVDELAGQVSSLLHTRVETVVELDDAGFSALVEGVAPLPVQNPDAVLVGDEVISAGEIALEADDVGPFLASQAPGESDLTRLSRQRVVWQAWLEAIGRGGSGVLPDGSALTPFLTTLSAGAADVEVLEVEPAAEAEVEEFVASPATYAQLTEAVPFPTAPAPGARWTAHVLNGWEGEEVSPELARILVEHGAQVEQVGNADELGKVATTILVGDESKLGLGRLIADVLGQGEVQLDPRLAGTVDLVVVAGRDLLAEVGG